MDLDCELVQDLYPLYVENELSPGVKKRVDDHLAVCEQCRSVYQREEGFSDPLPGDREVIAPASSLDEKVRHRLKRERYLRYLKQGLILALIIIGSYFLFFRFTFFMESSDLTRPSFERDYIRLQEKFGFSEEARVTHLNIQFDSSGQMQDARIEINDPYEAHVDVYSITFSPRIKGFHAYRIRHHRVEDPTIIAQFYADLPTAVSARKMFAVLDQIDYGEILTNIGAKQYWLWSSGLSHERVRVNYEVLPNREYYLIEEGRMTKLNEGDTLYDVYMFWLDTDTQSKREYLFK